MINPLVAVSKDVFVITNAQSTWVQMAFYGGYATMALPAENELGIDKVTA